MTEITDAFIKDATTEYLSHRGEQPYRILRGGQQLWETHAPSIRAALACANRLSPAPAPPVPTPVSADKDRWVVQGFDPEERGVAIIEERAGVPAGGTPTNGIQVWVPLWPSEWEDDDRAAYSDRALRVAARICDAVNASPPARSAATTVEPPVAWVIPGDDQARADGSIDAMAWQEGEFSRPLYAAPTTSPALKAGPVELRQLADEQDSLAKSFRAMHDTEESRACQIRAQALRLQITTSPEPSAIFHATGLAGERLARLQGSEPECKVCKDDPLICATVPSPHCDGSPEPDAVREKIKSIIDGYADSYRVMSGDGTGTVHAASVRADLTIHILPQILAALSAPVAGAWQEALEQIAAVCADNAGDECDQKLALRFVANVAGRALSRNQGQGGGPRS